MNELKTYLWTSLIVLLIYACGGGQSRIDKIKEQSVAKPEDPFVAWQSNHGVGPVAAFELPMEIDAVLAAEGQAVFEGKCSACHKPAKRFIGPPPKGILENRTPAWIMNMILNPEEMVKNDPMAKQLLIEFNGSPMANQNLTQEEARAVLEYFRTL
ncbi:MAG: cytochrome c [Cytophagales bacterium]|nr:cytochrome c [Cytophagales bacterium]